jgi:hypothetical protein
MTIDAFAECMALGPPECEANDAEDAALVAAIPECVSVIDGCLHGRDPPRDQGSSGGGCDTSDCGSCDSSCDEDDNGKCDTCDSCDERCDNECDRCSVARGDGGGAPLGMLAWLLMPLAYLRIASRGRT